MASLNGISVLAVDDIDVNRLMLGDMLTPEGACVVFAENGEQSLEILKQKGIAAFDVVLMDVQMPVMDGFEATRNIRLISQELPVIGLTAYALAEDRKKCLSAGMADVVTKPLNMKLLRAAILCQIERNSGKHPPGLAKKPFATGTVLDTVSAVALATIDWPALFALCDGRREFVRKLVISVRQHHAQTPEKLRMAAQKGDRRTVALIVHSLKGLNVEARRLHALTTAFAIDWLDDALFLAGVEELACAVEGVLAELRTVDQPKWGN